MVARSDSAELFVDPRLGPADGRGRGVERIDAILQRWWSQADLRVEPEPSGVSLSQARPLVFGPARIAR